MNTSRDYRRAKCYYRIIKRMKNKDLQLRIAFRKNGGVVTELNANDVINSMIVFCEDEEFVNYFRKRLRETRRKTYDKRNRNIKT